MKFSINYDPLANEPHAVFEDKNILRGVALTRKDAERMADDVAKIDGVARERISISPVPRDERA